MRIPPVSQLTIKSINMSKLIKPFELAKPQLEHITFVGTKEFLNQHLKLPTPENFCSLRRKNNICLSYSITTSLNCNHIRYCHMCFYNAKNYLNVLKYRKKLLNE